MRRLYLIATIAGRTVAIGSEQVDSVVDIGDVVAAPRTAHAVRGLAALRSRVVTVIDTRAALDLPPGGDAARGVILRVDGHLYAFLVDALDDVAEHELQPLANGLALDAAWQGIVLGLIDRGGEPMLAIDLARLVPALELAA